MVGLGFDGLNSPEITSSESYVIRSVLSHL
jgi:hypothetical protein